MYLNDTESAPWQRSDAHKQALAQKYSEELEQYKDHVHELFSAKTAAMKNAEAAAGKFPLVIFGTGGNTGGHVYSVLCEYLASHGYVAVALTALPLKKGERWPQMSK
ncbi:hypothetical protein L0337_05535 [candidate division KSB1 bacterium]|nr:hypothetical protein [candidate division KSB1 bacterium]